MKSIFLPILALIFSTCTTTVNQLPEQVVASSSPPATDVGNCYVPDSRDLTCVYVPGVLMLHLDRGGPDNLPINGTRIWDDVWVNGRVISLLAHNNLDGDYFYNLSLGMRITLIWSTGEQEVYVVQVISKWTNTLSGGVWNDGFTSWDGQLKLTTKQIYARYYQGAVNYERLVLQTCLENNSGIMMIVAHRVPSTPFPTILLDD